MKIQIPIFKKNFKNKKSEINPNIYWNYVLYLTVVLILGAFAFGFYVFIRIDKDFTTISDEQKEKTSTLKKERIDNILKYFEEREQKSIEILNSPAGIVDPSI